jgi:hypothetical protein
MRTIIVDPNEPVVIRSYRLPYEAELARVRLEVEEIPCMLLPDTNTELGNSKVRLAVRREDVEGALAILDAPPETPLDDEESDTT